MHVHGIVDYLLFCFSFNQKNDFSHSDIQISDDDDDDDDDTSEGGKNPDNFYKETQGDHIDISDIDTSADLFGK